ncbi:MAG: hypothetical protein ACLP50_33540 [Solirubrobacteraceae bacterium]
MPSSAATPCVRRLPPHQQIVRTTRGVSFSLCWRSRIEPDRFVGYLRLPVLACDGLSRRLQS